MTNHTHTFSLDALATSEAVDDLYSRERAASGRDYSIVTGNDPAWVGLPEGVSDVAGFVAGFVACGNEETTARVSQARQQAADLNVPAARSVKSVLHSRRAVGARYDLERVLSGDPLPWSRYERTRLNSGSKIVTLYVPVGANANTSAEALMWSPISALVVADLLESVGYRVEIWACLTVHVPTGTASVRCSLKSADQPVDLNALARVAHVACFRAVFAPTLMASHTGKVIPRNYGTIAPNDPATYGDDNGITMRHAYGLDACLAEIRRVVAKFQE